jgi:heme-degrading monooxygenase HmoA
MYARMLLVKLESTTKNSKVDLANRWHAAVSTLPGFLRVQFLFDESTNEYGYISYWESLEQANDAGEKVGEHLPKALRDMSISTLFVRCYEVYEPNN